MFVTIEHIQVFLLFMVFNVFKKRLGAFQPPPTPPIHWWRDLNYARVLKSTGAHAKDRSVHTSDLFTLLLK